MAEKRDLEQTSDRALSLDEIEGEAVTQLPNKEVMSLLDVNANVDLGLDLAAPVDLAAAANLNVAAPIEAAASANLLSPDAIAIGEAQQTGTIDQGISGTADATAPQHADITQNSDPTTGDGTTAGDVGSTGGTTDGTTTDGTTTGGTTTGGTTTGSTGGTSTTTGGVDSLLNGGS